MPKIQNICIQNSDFLFELKSADVTPVYKISKAFPFKTQIFFLNWNLQILPQYTKNPNHFHWKLVFSFWIEIRGCYPSTEKIKNICIQHSDILSELKSSDVTPVSKKSKTFAFNTQIFFLNWNLQLLPQYIKNPKYLHSKLTFSFWFETCRCYPSKQKTQNIRIQNSDFISELKFSYVIPVGKKSKTFAFKIQIIFLNWNLQILPQDT